jgi:hypothetical protein
MGDYVSYVNVRAMTGHWRQSIMTIFNLGRFACASLQSAAHSKLDAAAGQSAHRAAPALCADIAGEDVHGGMLVALI